jgi:hypothetical protein
MREDIEGIFEEVFGLLTLAMILFGLNLFFYYSF